jgi:hypothetical protein
MSTLATARVSACFFASLRETVFPAEIAISVQYEHTRYRSRFCLLLCVFASLREKPFPAKKQRSKEDRQKKPNRDRRLF